MNDEWVADAAPIIVLGKAGLLHLLPDLVADLLMPSQVAREIRGGPSSDPARLALDQGFGTCVPVRYIPVAIRRLPALHAGEKAVLALARQRGGCRVVLDDYKGRAAADALGLPKIGTLGILVAAARLGLVPSLRSAVGAVRAAGMYLDEATARAILQAESQACP
jgi:predicted nucleic acid-binding protein